MYRLVPRRIRDFVRPVFLFSEVGVVQSNLGLSHINGFGKVPRCVLDEGYKTIRMLSYCDDSVTDFSNRIGRTDFLLDSAGKVRLIEVEFRSHGLGVLQRFLSDFYPGQLDFMKEVWNIAGINLRDVVILYSEGRSLSEGGCRSDDHLYCADQISWSEEISDALIGKSVIVRSCVDERVPDSLCAAIIHGEISLVMPLFEANKEAMYSALQKQFGVVSLDTLIVPEFSGETVVQRVKRHFFSYFKDFDVSVLVCKPVYGARSHNVFCVSFDDLHVLSESSRAVTCIQNGDEYVVQPFYPCLHGVHHLYRLFFLRDSISFDWKFLVGLLQFGPEWIVHGRDGTENMLLFFPE